MPDINTDSVPQNICNLFTSTLHKTYISIIPAQHPLVTTILIILGSIIITLFPSLGLKFGTAFPKAIEDYESTYSKRKFKHHYIYVTLETLDSYVDTSTLISEINKAS